MKLLENINRSVGHLLPILFVISIFYDKIFGPILLVWLAINIFMSTKFRMLELFDIVLIVFVVINIARMTNVEFISPSFQQNFFSELKFLLFITLVMLVRISPMTITSKSIINDYTVAYLIGVIFLMVYVVLQGKEILRFPDSHPLSITTNSIYFGAVTVLLISVSNLYSKVAFTAIVLVNMSTTPIVGLYTYLLTIIKKRKEVVFFSIAFLIIVLISQSLRGRQFSTFFDWDRVQLVAAYYNSHIRTSELSTIIFGNGPAVPLGEVFIEQITNPKLVQYVISESQPQFSSILHNEYLRIFHSYGLIGLLFVIYTIFRALRYLQPAFHILLAMMLFNSILYPTSLMITILILSIFFKESTPSEDNSNYCSV